MSYAGAPWLRPLRDTGQLRPGYKPRELPSQLHEALDIVAAAFQDVGHKLHGVVLPYEMRLVLEGAPGRWEHRTAAGSLVLSFGPKYAFVCAPTYVDAAATAKLRRLGWGDSRFKPADYMDGV